MEGASKSAYKNYISFDTLYTIAGKWGGGCTVRNKKLTCHMFSALGDTSSDELTFAHVTIF